MGEVRNLTGDMVRGAGWYGHTTGLHSVAIRGLNFQGRIKVQATIATTPAIDDWFSVLPNGVAYLEYPQLDYIIPLDRGGETSTMGFNFASNAVWLRAIVERDYLLPPMFASPLDMKPFGTVQYIMVNY